MSWKYSLNSKTRKIAIAVCDCELPLGQLPFEHMEPQGQETYYRYAREALRVMRVPTNAMLEAAQKRFPAVHRSVILSLYKAMIEAAIEER